MRDLARTGRAVEAGTIERHVHKRSCPPRKDFVVATSQANERLGAADDVERDGLRPSAVCSDGDFRRPDARLEVSEWIGTRTPDLEFRARWAGAIDAVGDPV
jgi:hypothetical protein